MTSPGLDKINRLDEAANFLMLVADQEKGLSETCSLAPEVALNLLQPLHAMIDQEIKATNKKLITVNALAVCETDCHCGIYSDLAEDPKLKNDLLLKAQSLPKKKLVTCAELTSRWFCKDVLLEELKSELGQMAPDAL